MTRGADYVNEVEMERFRKRCAPEESGDQTNENVAKALDAVERIEARNPKDIAGSRKPPLHLIPPVANVIESRVLELGAKKYGAFNWRQKKIEELQYVGAILRHAAAIIDGEEVDPESGELHWGHIRATSGIVLDAKSLGCVKDERPPPGAAAETIRRMTRPLPDSTEVE